MSQFGSASVAAVLAVAAVAALYSDGRPWRARAARALDRLANRRGAALAACAALAFCGSAAVALVVHWPEPVIHDELSQLLAADTFASGRLTNPKHPQWQHFESFHVFHEPTYASKYPPAPALFMAVGQVLTSQPLVGVWLGGAAMAAALCWMLYAFVEPRWALIAGLLATLQLGVSTYWTQSYWGGAVAAAGAALVFGAAARLVRSPRPRDSFWLGVGLVVLANSRPFEGALIASAPVVWLLWRLLHSRPGGGARLTALVPAALVLLVGFAAMAYYNHVVVGRWWMPPYLHHELLYARRPALSFLPEAPDKIYRHRELRDFYSTGSGTRRLEHEQKHATADDAAAASQRSSAGQPPPHEPEKSYDFKAVSWLQALEALRSFMTGRALLLPLVVGCLLLRREGVLVAAAGLGLTAVVIALSRYFRPHYVAPAAAPIIILVGVGLQRLSGLRVRGWALGSALCALVAAATVIGMMREPGYDAARRARDGSDDFVRMRSRVVAALRAEPGDDLVVVRYGRRHDLHREWVYNAADIDASDIVWARDMGEQGNQGLVRYFADRKVWLLRVGYGADRDGLVRIDDPRAPWPADPRRREHEAGDAAR